MARILLIGIIFFGFGNGLAAQTQKDVCRVHIVDLAQNDRAYDAPTEAEEKRLGATAEKLFPVFYPTIGEEELTTKTYRFPRSKLFITASVFYTDESMATGESSDSIIVGLVVSRHRRRSALNAPNNAVAEGSYTGKPMAIRAMKWLRVNRRFYIVGLECRNDGRSE